MIVQLLGIVIAQALLNVSSPAGYLLFIIPSVLVSLAFTPILLSAQPRRSSRRSSGCPLQSCTRHRRWAAWESS